MPFKSYKEKFSQFMGLLDHIVNPDRIVTFNKYLDKVDLKNHSITLMIGNILEYQNVNI